MTTSKTYVPLFSDASANSRNWKFALSKKGISVITLSGVVYLLNAYQKQDADMVLQSFTA